MPDIVSVPTDANAAVALLLKDYARNLGRLLGGDVLGYKGPIFPPADVMIRDALESRTKKNNKLLVVLETEGGSLDVVVRIVDTMRHHYPDCVEFVVPNYAFSAGTVLVLSGNEIHMDYFSVLGPTDPQDEGSDGKVIPALGYVERYDELMEKASQGEASSAEVAILLRYDEGRIKMYRHMTEQAKALLMDWLPRYKFRDWEETEHKGEPVTAERKKQRAGEIADSLSETKKWHSHGRGINRETLEREVRLKIKDFSVPPKLHQAVRSYSGLLVDLMVKMGMPMCVHTTDGFVWPFKLP